MFVGKEE